MSVELDRLAIAAEADRLAVVYEHVRLLARAQRIGFEQAGRDAVAKGLISVADWLMLQEARDE